MKEIKLKFYYVIYKSEDTGWYETRRQIISVVENEEVAKDFCNKFGTRYETLIVGNDTIPATLNNCF